MSTPTAVFHDTPSVAGICPADGVGHFNFGDEITAVVGRQAPREKIDRLADRLGIEPKALVALLDREVSH